MTVVYILEGWFGDQEWIEGVYARGVDAEQACSELWINRSSDKGPEHSRGLHKFAVSPWPVLGGELS